MQKLLVKLKNPLQDASQVLNPGNSDLNREKILSDQNKVLANNNLDVNLSVEAEALSLKSEILWSECKPHKFKKGGGFSPKAKILGFQP